MKTVFITTLTILFLCNAVQGQQCRTVAGQRVCSVVQAATTPLRVVSNTVQAIQIAQPVQTSIAQTRSNIQASQGMMRHVGPVVGGSCEGVGFSTYSANDAIQRSCYWGQRTPVNIGVARGRNGWYATVIYR
jgi:hypothetical protein